MIEGTVSIHVHKVGRVIRFITVTILRAGGTGWGKASHSSKGHEWAGQTEQVSKPLILTR